MDLLNVFVSRPTWVEDKFKTGLQNFYNEIEDLGLRARTIGVTDQPTKAPLDEVINLLDKCRGTVILGYPQIKFSNGFIKNDKKENVILATEWNHIEAGLTYARDLPLLVIHHKNVIRGIFDRGALNSFIYEVDLTDVNWPSSSDMTKALKKWRDECLIRDQKERKKIEHIEQKKSQELGAKVTVKLIGQPGDKVCIKNHGPGDVKNVNISFPDGDNPIIESEYSSKLPIKTLPVGSEFKLIAGVSYNVSPPFYAELEWEDNTGKNSKTYPLTVL